MVAAFVMGTKSALDVICRDRVSRLDGEGVVAVCVNRHAADDPVHFTPPVEIVHRLPGPRSLIGGDDVQVFAFLAEALADDVVGARLVEHEAVGVDGDLVVGNAPRDVAPAVEGFEDPGLFRVGDEEVARIHAVPMLLDEIDHDVEALASRLCPPDHLHAQVVADAVALKGREPPLVRQFVFLLTPFAHHAAVVGGDEHAVLVVEGAGDFVIPVEMLHVGPESRRLAVPPRQHRIAHERLAAVFVVADEHMSRRARLFAHHDRRAGVCAARREQAEQEGG